MKKFIIAIGLSLALLSPVMAADVVQSPVQAVTYSYSYPADWNPTAPCGWDFVKSNLYNVPSRYCWAKQDRGNVTFFGLINVACSGTSCKLPNNVNNGQL